jgi:transposase
LVKNFLSNNNVTTPELPPYSPELVPADFFLFPQMKSALKEQRFCVATDIINNATEQLKSLSQHDFQECLQHLHSRWQKCVGAKRDYFEGNIF